MASSFLTKLLSGIKSFLKNMASPLGGFSIDDAKMNVKDGEYSVLYQFGTEQSVKDEAGGDITNIKGEKIPLTLLLSTVNVKDALAPLLKGLNEMGMLKNSNPKEFRSLMYLMLGDEKYKSADTPQDQSMDSAMLSTQVSNDLQSVMAVESNNEYLTAKNAGKGLLGVDLETNGAIPSDSVSFGGKQWSWQKIADDYLNYALECAVPGKDYGAISGVTLSKCADLIPEYLTKITNTIASKSEVNVDLTSLVRPLLIRIQADLVEYFTDAYNKGIENKTTAEKEAEELEQQETADQNNNDNSGENPTEDTTQQTGDDNGMNANQPQTASKHIDVTLQKITGTTSFNMTMIKANYEPTLVLADMDEIISQPEFIESLPEELTTYAIDVDDDGFDIEPCEECIECNPCESLCEVFKAGIRAYRNLYILHWMSSGNDMMKLHNLSEEMYAELNSEIDTIGELLVEKQGTVPQLDFPCDYIPVQQYDFQTGLDQIKSLIQMYIDCIDYAYCNQTSDVQSTLDEWLRYWNKQLNYFVKGQEA